LFFSVCTFCTNGDNNNNNRQQTRDLNVCWNTVYRTVLNFNLWKSVKGFISGLRKPSFHCILKVSTVKFYYHLLHVDNALFLDLLWLCFKDCFHKVDCLH